MTSYSSAFARVSRPNPCPICHKPDWCEVAEDGTVAHCMRAASDRPLDYRGGGWLHFLGRPAAGNWASRARHQPNQNQTGAGLDQARLDLVNRAITRLLGLSNEHAAYIAKQYPGLDPALFGSYQPGRDCYALAGRLSEAGFEQAEILQHPAFKPTEIQNHRDGETMTAIQFAGNEPGLIIPAIDEDEASGLVMGLQIRLEKTPQHGGKYRWVAWPGRGNAPASFLLAQPATATAAKMLLITEGLKKAAQARAHYDCHAVSLPGVAIQPLPQILKWIDRAGVSRVVVAFDADKAENEAVAAQEKRLLDALLVARPGLVLERANWPGAAGKGLDNVLQGGKAGAISFELYAPGDSGKLKADLELNQPFLDYLPTTGKKAALLHSPKGSNKTGVMADRVAQNIFMGRKTLIISHRVILAGQQAERMGAVLYSDFKGQEDYEQMSEALALVITPDSLPKLNLSLDNYPAGGFDLMIDESEQLLQHLCGSTIRDKRRAVLVAFEAIVKRAGRIILADADMSIITFEWLAGLIGAENIEVVVNERKPAPKEIIAFDQAGNWQIEINSWLDAGKRLFAPTNSKAFAQALERYINTQWPELRVLRIDSDNSGSPDMQDNVMNINEVVTGYDVLICSPSAGTGLNIHVPHFDATFLYAVGKVTTHKDLHQQAARVRQTTSGKIFCYVDSKKYTNAPVEAEQLRRQHQRNQVRSRGGFDLMHEATENEKEFEARYLALWANIKASRHQSWQNLRANFYKQAMGEGQEIVCADGSKASGLVAGVDPKEKTALLDGAREALTAIKRAKEDLREEAAAAALAAAKIDQAEADKLKRKAYKLPHEKAQHERFIIETFYGQEISQELIKRDNRGKFRSKLQNFMEFEQTSRAGSRDQAERDNPELMQTDHHHFLSKAKMRRRILAAAGLFALAGTGAGAGDEFFSEFNAAKLTERSFSAWCWRNSQAISDVLGIRVRSDIAANPVKLVSEVLRGMGLALQSRQYRTGEYEEVEKPDGTKKRRAVMGRDYWIDAEKWEQVTALADSRANWLAGLDLERIGVGLDWRDGIVDQAA